MLRNKINLEWLKVEGDNYVVKDSVKNHGFVITILYYPTEDKYHWYFTGVWKGTPSTHSVKGYRELSKAQADAELNLYQRLHGKPSVLDSIKRLFNK